MIRNLVDNIEEENDVLFNVIRANCDDFNEIDDINKIGLCKIILRANNIIRTFYFKNGIETSREIILQDERIKKLRR